ncbi:cytochrome oxidase c subunit VIb-domain-containing protein [Podospora fimiseda]|uniref:Cytochrome oxidase c subunit VIb-domain-containing protein n=1 Tax=Podospora fimiseda TaxID=252190 RepID=A0AAN7BNN3_9PEZI|nr:cytochrome oxidase c subunit VIb-domain-containing protein [Podospora fimiseda]
MALFGLFGRSSEEQKRADSIRTGAVAPTRSERQKCWEARDAYFACLDANNIVDALKEDKKAAKVCKLEGQKFEADCATQWVCLQ